MADLLTMHTPYGDYEVDFILASYVNNDNTAVLIRSKAEDGNYMEPWGDMTVNIVDLPAGMACLDTNNSPYIEQFVIENGLGEPAGFSIPSGFCKFPVYKLDIEKIKEHAYDTENYKEKSAYDNSHGVTQTNIPTPVEDFRNMLRAYTASNDNDIPEPVNDDNVEDCDNDKEFGDE